MLIGSLFYLVWGQVSSHMKIFVCGQVSSHMKLNKVSLKSLNFSCIHGVLLHHMRHNQRHNMNCLLYSENAITKYPHGTYRAFLQGSLHIYSFKEHLHQPVKRCEDPKTLLKMFQASALCKGLQTLHYSFPGTL